MAGEWTTARIEEVVERVAMGPFGSSIKVETFVKEGVPVISGQHLHGSRLDETPGFNFITPEHAKRLRNANVRRGDVIFTHAGNIGQVAFIPRTSVHERYVISQRQFYLRPDKNKVLPEFLVAYFHSPAGRHKLLANTSQVGVPSIAQPVTYLRSLEIPLPPLSEQRAIAHILGTLDDKIELNRRMSETLEAMARALFKSWFIDFEPVRRNAARARNQPSSPVPFSQGEKGRPNYRGWYDFAGLVKTVRELRRKQMSAEELFWELVRDRRFMQLKFRRQHQIADYVVDFYCHEHRLVVELDGGVHAERRKRDHKRDAWLESQGFRVLRFTNEELFEDPQSVLARIADALPPSPPRRGVGGEGVIESCAFDHLFPDRLVASELGEIPEGWEVGTLGELAEITSGKRPQVRFTEWSREAPIPLWGGNGPMGYVHEPLTKKPILLTGRVGTLGSVFRIPTPCWPSDNTLIVRSKQPFAFEYLFFQLRFIDYDSLNRGSTQPLLTQTDLKSHRMIVPIRQVLVHFSRFAGSAYGRIDCIEEESRTLASLRDALLPKLISGEIRVRDAEKFLKERGL